MMLPLSICLSINNPLSSVRENIRASIKIAKYWASEGCKGQKAAKAVGGKS